jgi:NADPH-dependent 2,4-dienoyl-CoA reductase/sulfur reductase-like enzyme
MSNLHVKYLLVGGGVASSAAAQAIREIDKDGACLLVSQEINRPYHRPPLSKEYLRREKEREYLFTVPAAWYTQNNVQLRTARRVAHLDCPRRMVTLDDGEEIAFDKLLLAVGGVPAKLAIPGANLPNIYYLRTIEDAQRLRTAVDKAKAEGKSRAAVIGGGVLGVELAASFTQMGLNVDLIVGSDHPWNHFAGEVTGRFVSRFLEARGVTVQTGARPERLEGDGRVQRVVLGAGKAVEADFVAAAVGMSVNKELLRGTQISAEKAILTNDHCRTSEPDVYAAGDCAAVFDPLFNKHRVLDHWDNANVTGAVAGKNMAGVDTRYDAVNNFFSDLFDLSMNGWGEARLVDRRLIRGAPNVESPDFIEIGIASDGRVCQVLSIGHKGDDEVLKRLVGQRVQIDGNQEQIKDPQFDLTKLVSLR